MSTKRIKINPSKKKGESKVEIILNEELTIYTIEEIKDDILNAVKKYDDITFNGSEVKNMDLTFVQLLESIQKSINNTKKTLNLNIELNKENRLLFTNTDINKIVE